MERKIASFYTPNKRRAKVLFHEKKKPIGFSGDYSKGHVELLAQPWFRSLLETDVDSNLLSFALSFTK